MMNAQNMIRSMISTLARKSAATKISDAANVIYLIHPIFFLGCSGFLYGRRSRTIAVQQAYPHQPRPNSSGPNILATA